MPALEITRVPAEIVVVPLYVLVPCTVSVPALNLVRVPTPFLMPPCTTIAASDAVSNVRLYGCVMSEPNVSVPELLWISTLFVRVTEPVIVLFPDVLTTAPPALMPAPDTCIVSAKETLPEIAIAAPLPTTVAPALTSLPRALFFCTCSVPAVTVVIPVYVFADDPDNVSVLTELVSLRRAPAPEITPDST